jgi:glycosyltransferase involved in cell wall biosynthesis
MSCRVLHVIPAVAPRYGGPSVATFGFCHALEASGVDTVVATTDADGADRLPVETGTLQKYRGVTMVFFPRIFSESFKWSGPLSSWVHEHVGAFDLVHIHAVFSHSSIAAGHACRKAGVPYVVRPLGNLDPWSLAQHRMRKQLLMKIAVGEMLRGATAIHYTSAGERALAERALSWLPAGIVVPLGVDDASFTSSVAPRSARPYVLALSRLHVKKGLDLLVDAFHGLAQAGASPAWRLVIAGDGEASYVAQLQKRAAAGPASDRIEFRGWVNGDDRRTLLERASLLALPSHQENFGLAVAEAMASGVPVMVAPGVNLADDITGHSAGWVVERDARMWISALRDALGDGPELERRGRNARAAADQYRWPAVGQQLADAYDGLLRRQPDPARDRRTVADPRWIAPASSRTER